MGSHNVQGADRSKGEMVNSVMVMLGVLTEIHEAVANGQAILLIKADDWMQGYLLFAPVCTFDLKKEKKNIFYKKNSRYL